MVELLPEIMITGRVPYSAFFADFADRARWRAVALDDDVLAPNFQKKKNECFTHGNGDYHIERYSGWSCEFVGQLFQRIRHALELEQRLILTTKSDAFGANTRCLNPVTTKSTIKYLISKCNGCHMRLNTYRQAYIFMLVCQSQRWNKLQSNYRSLTKQVTPVHHASLAGSKNAEDWLTVSPIKSNLYSILNEAMLIVHNREQKKLNSSLFRYQYCQKDQLNAQLCKENQNCL